MSSPVVREIEAKSILNALSDSFFRAQAARLAKALQAGGIRVESVF